MSEQPWTIERICESLGNPKLSQRFLSEINRAPAHLLLTVFAKWERIAKNLEVAFADTSEILAAEARSEEPPGRWIDGDERLQQVAQRIRSHEAS